MAVLTNVGSLPKSQARGVLLMMDGGWHFEWTDFHFKHNETQRPCSLERFCWVIL